MQSTPQSHHQPSPIINIMEVIVLDQVDRELEKLSPRLAYKVKSGEVAAYALNRLPALYATSHEGYRYQIKRAKHRYGQDIYQVVRQAILAIIQDPLKNSTPLKPSVLRKIPAIQFAQSPSPKDIVRDAIDANNVNGIPQQQLSVRELAYQEARQLRIALNLC